jgi:hypothetical protein
VCVGVCGRERGVEQRERGGGNEVERKRGAIVDDLALDCVTEQQ